MTDQYAVLGNPVTHSRSPFIHACFARQQHQRMEYRAIEAPLDGFQSCVSQFLQGDGKGANVTVPFKEQAWRLAACRTPRAELAGAVNTLWRDESGQLWGDNTDGIGLVTDLTQNVQVKLEGARILMLGAGGAVRGVIQPLLDAGCSQLFIANRTAEKAQQLVDQFAPLLPEGVLLQGGGYTSVPSDGEFDLIINGTSASLSGDLPPLNPSIVGAHTLCYDMMYSARPTAFCQWAIEHHAGRAVDGLGMLVEQAAEAFLCWRGVRPDTAPVISLLRQSLAQQ